MVIYIPNSFIPERQYIINCIFRDFLGLDFDLQIHEDPDKYIIVLTGEVNLIIKDAFFSRFSESEGYLAKLNVPVSIQYFGKSFPGYEDTPILFGDNQIIYNNGSVDLGADVFASAFFMLTRWEEHVIHERDSHNRFPCTSSFAYRNNFLDRPVVNEYVDLLWELLLKIGYKGQRVKRKYTIVPTHDIDHLIYWGERTKKNLIRNLTGDLFKRKNPKLAAKKVISFCRTYLDNTRDPNYAYDYFMELAETADIKANFYFIAGGDDPHDPDFYLDTPVFKKVITRIKERGHKIGIHPSYDSYNKQVVLKNEIKRLEEAANNTIDSGRQHYLRFEVPDTWRIWDECNLKIDSSMYYSGFPGFRCGTCYEFLVFDIIRRKSLALIEMPLLMMDTCLLNHDPDYTIESIRKVKHQVKKHYGNFVFVWHNSNTFSEPLKSFKSIFEKEFYG